MKEEIHKLNKFGRGKHASAAVGGDNDDGDVELNFI